MNDDVSVDPVEPLAPLDPPVLTPFVGGTTVAPVLLAPVSILTPLGVVNVTMLDCVATAQSSTATSCEVDAANLKGLYLLRY